MRRVLKVWGVGHEKKRHNVGSGLVPSLRLLALTIAPGRHSCGRQGEGIQGSEHQDIRGLFSRYCTTPWQGVLLGTTRLQPCDLRS